jgi:23S rRNA (uracil1939-C5)-methyltransferase
MLTARGAELVIDKLIPEGKALGRLEDGRVVIASGALPGDRIQLEVVSERKGLVSAHGFRLLAPSPLRIPPSCAWAERCGGCDWMALPLAEQRRHKLEILREALLRTGKIDWRGRPLELFGGQLAEGYRGRVRLQIAGGRIGFFHQGSHDLVEPATCAVSSDAVNAALGHLRELARAYPAALDAFAWLEVRAASDGSVAVLLQPNETESRGAGRRRRPVPDELLWLEALRGRYRVMLAGEAPGARALQRYQLTDDTFMLSAPGGFVQVNWEVNRELIARVLSGAESRGVQTFLDAYAGSGNFALPLLRRGLSGVAVESNAGAVTAAREAARQQGLDPAAFVSADAAAHARELVRSGGRVELVLVDPPRAGLQAGLEALARCASRWFVMCSCNPVTLARDLGRLVALGFELEAIEAFDMFPQTHHLETLAWLRAPASRAM